MIKKIIEIIMGLIFGKKKPLPPIVDPTEGPQPIDVKIIEIDGKKYKITYYNNGTSKKEEIT